jgi:TolB protein
MLGLATLAACKPPPVHVAPAPVEKTLAVTGAGSALERVTSDPLTETTPALSPDGKVLLFGVRVYESETSDDIKQKTLVSVDPNTRAQRTLFTSSNSFSEEPAWLPDQSSYVYSSNSPGQWSLVRALTASPNAAVSVIASGEIAPGASWPSVSPDGQRIAFATVVRGTSTLAVIGVDGSRFTLLGDGYKPSWSPDGSALVFERTVAGMGQLFLVNPETGTNLVQLTSGEVNHSYPSWSPDGKYIVFSTDRGWNRYPDASWKRIKNLYIINRDGTGLTQLTDGNTLALFPHWGRDNWIYFASDQSGNFDIWRIKPAGKYGDLQPIAPSKQGAAPSPAPAAPPPPAASPTGPVFGPVPAPKPPPAAASGCTKDTDCKGNRVCEQGACVAPPP